MKIAIYLGVLVLITCTCSEKNEKRLKSSSVQKVELRKDSVGFKLYRNGEPYYVKGAGGTKHLELAKQLGANSIRTWTTYGAKEVLDKADSLGLTVTLCLDIGRPRLGFDYGNKDARKKQLEWVEKEVLKFKDHPALLMWAVGNEVNEEWGEDIKLWKGVNEVAAHVHELDPNHPTTTIIVPKTTALISLKYFCPEIDILSINTFGALHKLSSKLRKNYIDWDGAYIVTEWGGKGHWETDSTLWAVPIEMSSTQKANFFKENYSYIMDDKEKCIGNYVFFWGHKQERTNTWFSLFSEKGEKNGIVDMMGYLWSGSYPENRAPEISEIKLNRKLAIDNVVIFNDSTLTNMATISGTDPESDTLYYYWEIRPETVNIKMGGDTEKIVDVVDNIKTRTKGNKFYFQSPRQAGGYRIYVYVADGNKNVSNANFPFYVLFK